MGAAGRLWTAAQGPHDGTARSIEGRRRQDRPSCEALKNARHQHRGPFAGAARRRDDGSMLGEAASLAGAKSASPATTPLAGGAWSIFRTVFEDGAVRRRSPCRARLFVCLSCPRCRSLGATDLKSLRIASTCRGVSSVAIGHGAARIPNAAHRAAQRKPKRLPTAAPVAGTIFVHRCRRCCPTVRPLPSTQTPSTRPPAQSGIQATPRVPTSKRCTKR